MLAAIACISDVAFASAIHAAAASNPIGIIHAATTGACFTVAPVCIRRAVRAAINPHAPGFAFALDQAGGTIELASATICIAGRRASTASFLEVSFACLISNLDYTNTTLQA